MHQRILKNSNNGVVGIVVEVFFTAVTYLFKNKKGRTLKGHSSVWMFFIYGTAYFIILFGISTFLSVPIIQSVEFWLSLFVCLCLTRLFVRSHDDVRYK